MNNSSRYRIRYPWLYSKAVKCRVILIAGMHRSGTGLVSRILQNIGVFMGNELTGNEESVFFLSLNKEVLDMIGCNWRCLDHLPTLSESSGIYKWMVGFVRRRLEEGLVKFHFGLSAIRLIFNQRFIWGWKDPRNSLLLPVWRELFPKSFVIHVFRDGRDVALSLLKRDLKRERGALKMSAQAQRQRYLGYFNLWEEYIRRIKSAEEVYGPFYPLRFEDLLERTDSVIDDLKKAVGLNKRKTFDSTKVSVDRKRHGRYREPEFPWAEEATYPSRLLRELGYK